MILRMLLAAAVVIATEPCPASVSDPTGSGRAEGTYLKTVNATSTASRGRTSQSEGGRGAFRCRYLLTREADHCERVRPLSRLAPIAVERIRSGDQGLSFTPFAETRSDTRT